MDYPFQIYIADTETTGLDYLQHDIVELSLYHLNQDRQKTWQLKAMRPESAQPDALRINGHKLEDISHKTAEGRASYGEPKDVIVSIENWMLEDMASPEEKILCGQNIQFDENFLRVLWDSNGAKETYPFGNRPFILDTRQIELFINLIQGKRNEYYNLGSLVEKYGVKKLKSHRADADTLMTKEVFLKQLEVFGVKSS
jgi:DNA polymerase III epsilon subunit-like protein